MSHENLAHYVLVGLQSFKAVEVIFVLILAKNHRESILKRTRSQTKCTNEKLGYYVQIMSV